MSGDSTPRKRGNKRRKKDVGNVHVEHATAKMKASFDEDDGAPPLAPGDERIHVHKDISTGGGVVAKIIFFILFLGLLGTAAVVILEYRGTSDVDIPTEESRFGSLFAGWVDENIEKHDVSEEEEGHEEDHDEHSGEAEEVEGSEEDHEEEHDDLEEMLSRGIPGVTESGEEAEGEEDEGSKEEEDEGIQEEEEEGEEGVSGEVEEEEGGDEEEGEEGETEEEEEDEGIEEGEEEEGGEEEGGEEEGGEEGEAEEEGDEGVGEEEESSGGVEVPKEEVTESKAEDLSDEGEEDEEEEELEEEVVYKSSGIPTLVEAVPLPPMKVESKPEDDGFSWGDEEDLPKSLREELKEQQDDEGGWDWDITPSEGTGGRIVTKAEEEEMEEEEEEEEDEEEEEEEEEEAEEEEEDEIVHIKNVPIAGQRKAEASKVVYADDDDEEEEEEEEEEDDEPAVPLSQKGRSTGAQSEPIISEPVYEKASITNDEDFVIRQELDEAEVEIDRGYGV